MKNWTSAKLADVCTLITDGTHHSPVNLSTGAYKYVTAKNIRRWGLDISNITYVDEATHNEIYSRCPAEYGDVLYIKDGVTTGIAALNTLREPFSMLSSVALLKPIPGILNSSYLKHWLNSPIAYKSMTGEMTGTAIKRLVLKQIRETQIAIAPQPEQTRIAEKLDTVLTRVDACRDRLARVVPLLKRFRQSVLAAATSGRLTEDWEDGNGRTDWMTTKVESVSHVGTGSTPLRSNTDYFSLTGVPWITSGATSQELILSCDEYVTQQAITDHRLKIYPAGTLLVAMYGEGKTRGQVSELGIPATINQACAAVVVDPKKALVKYVKLALQANYLEMRVLAEGGNQPNLNLSKVKEFPLNMPGIAEQTEIVRRVETLFAFADRLEARLKTAQTAADRLTPALLAKAFRGELVPQDPNDEPAAELLKRLATSRDAAPKAKRGRRSATADTTS
ncbi:restriction endonuclease subunit S [Sphaerotilus montanus]|uniref:Type I restriction enzyme S subunit n=1 Tax=Sphaerotilus montanus TaxID=522889 RepID=A0A7Y9QVJ7_9BURK|nr:restriction endonuclease subunit S [Sphaerotilus montanus]NYG31444.1 type I restriction enzyme S subunit [Sphaerotilus montanus]NZD55425.1 restriction endonuclease subunit S [Sphaerotilus montanus]